MRQVIALVGVGIALFASSASAGVYVIAANPGEAFRLEGTIIGGFDRGRGTMLHGEVSFSDWIGIELLDPHSNKVISTLIFDGADSADGRLVAGSPGRKLKLGTITPRSSAYQEVGSWGLN